MKNIKAVIFDCDGVLIDSEHLACAMEAEYLTNLGYKITTDEFMDRYMGQSFTITLRDLKNKGFDIDVDTHKTFDSEMIRTPQFKAELKTLPLIEDTLKKLNELKIPYAIASGSSMDRLNYTLRLVGLDKYFENRIFSAELVKNPKPAPDIFLYSADKLGVNPSECLVIEDGVHGTTGAIKAGMKVFGYTKATHMNYERINSLKNAGAEIISDNINEIFKLISVA